MKESSDTIDDRHMRTMSGLLLQSLWNGMPLPSHGEATSMRDRTSLCNMASFIFITKQTRYMHIRP